MARVNATKKRVPVLLRLDPGVFRRIRAEAVARGLVPSAFIRMKIQEMFQGAVGAS
jgi:hypothetical protein